VTTDPLLGNPTSWIWQSSSVLAAPIGSGEVVTLTLT